MPNLPGVETEVFFGSTEEPLPDYRERPEGDDPDRDPEDEVTEESRRSVAGRLGLDPAELDDQG